MSGGWVYIMANRAYGVLYIGVTSSLPHRAMQHRDGTGSEFCRRYRLDRAGLCRATRNNHGRYRPRESDEGTET